MTDLEQSLEQWRHAREVDAHLLTVGSPTRGLCFRVTLGRIDRRGRWRRWQPCVFLIWRGRRV